MKCSSVQHDVLNHPFSISNPASRNASGSGCLFSRRQQNGIGDFRPHPASHRLSGAVSLSAGASGFESSAPDEGGFHYPRLRRSQLKLERRMRRPSVGLLADSKHRLAWITCRGSTSKRQWQEYEEAVQNKDLGSALELLDILNTFESDGAGSRAENPESSVVAAIREDDETVSEFALGSEQARDFLKILDACQETMDLGLVGRAYEWLQVRGFLKGFGKFKSRASEGERVVTPAVMMEVAGLEASKLSPRKWGLTGNSALILPLGFAFFSYLVDIEIDVRPVLALILGLSILDGIYLGGTGVGQVLSLWPPYRRRVLVHEAGHVLVAYLLGCPVRGVVLDAMQAMRMGIQGQAGTQFWDETLENELRQDKLTGATIDRYSIVLFAGIAAEAFTYGEADGGESDENLFKSVVSQLQPPWSPAKMSNQARWAVLQAFNLIKENKKAHQAVVGALGQGASLGSLIKTIEESMT